MHTSFFPAFRARLAPMGRRVEQLRQQSLCHLELLLGPLLPPGLLAQAEEGANSRERVFSVRRTFFGFLYQVLKPDTACREIVRQVQALLTLQDRGRADENTSAYCQARKRLGKNDRLFTWLKPSQKPRWLPQSWWKQIPAQLTVRVIRFKLACSGYRPKSVTLVTTLLDAQKYPASDIAQLYARRWKIELWFRDIKTSMGMEVLRCKSPQLLHKEREMFFIAYNLIRCLIAQAGVINDVELDRLSFKGTVDSVRQFSLAIAQARSKKMQKQLIAELLEVIARDQVPERPDRREPRAVKRRPKAYQLLNRPRHAMKEISHRSKYRKNA